MKYQISDWAHRFENSSSRKLKELNWVAIPTGMHDEGYIMLIDHPNGAAHFGAWVAIIQIASKQNPRGALPNGKLSQSLGGLCQSLGRISRLPSEIFEEVIPRLIEIGWLEISAESASVSAESASVSAESPGTLGKSADTDIHTDNKTDNKQTNKLSSVKATSTFENSTPTHVTETNGNGNGWHAFIEAYESTGRQTIPADFKHCQALWKKLDLAEQLACVSGIRRDIEGQKYSGPEFWPKPKKYLLDHEWERKPQKRRKPGRDLMEGVFDA